MFAKNKLNDIVKDGRVEVALVCQLSKEINDDDRM